MSTSARAVLLRGVNMVVRGLTEASPRVLRAYRAAVRLEAERIMAASQEEVPVKTGNLKNSKLVVQDDRADGTAVIFGYRAHYAAPVHEAPPTTNFAYGKAKFLEDPIKRLLPEFGKRVAETVEEELGGVHKGGGEGR